MTQIQNLRLYDPAIISAERPSFVSQNKPDIGFHNLLFPLADYIEPKSKAYRIGSLE
jgi:hypothetical protein